jgi:type IV pilus assembly protein PilY1
MKNSTLFSVLILAASALFTVKAQGHSRQFVSLLTKYVYGANNSYCYEHMDRTTYDSGFSSTDFSSSLSVDIVNNALVLNTDQRVLGDTNKITIRTRQNLTVKYVYESADQSQSLGWFLWDDRVKQYTEINGWNYSRLPCSSNDDCDSDDVCMVCSGIGCAATKVCSYPRRVLKTSSNGAKTFFQKVWRKPSDSTYVYTQPYNIRPFPTSDPYPWKWWTKTDKLWVYDYNNLTTSSFTDYGTFPKISNFIEDIIDGGGGWLYLLADDDTDYQTTVTCLSWDYNLGYCAYSVVHWQWGSFYLPPYKDNYNSYDGVPDYDVNGDGSVNTLDRTVDMGDFDSGTEIVFLLNSYYRNTNARYESVGMKYHSSFWYPTARVGTMPYFSKSVLNPDLKATGSYLRTLDIGCSYTKSNGYPGNQCLVDGSYVMGWLDQGAINRLNTSAYNFLQLDHEAVTFYTIDRGIRNHVLLGAPSNDPTRWILGFEQLYDGGPGGEDNAGNDYNDVVILIERQNGGEIISNEIATEIPAGEIANSTITKVRLTKDDYIPPSPICAPYPETRIDYYISVGYDANGDEIWYQVEFPPGEDEITIDLAALGLTGAHLKWKVEIISSNENCKPEVRDIDIGYEALRGGDYSFSTPIPLANVMFKGTLETPSSSWTITGNDARNRGHYYLYELYDPENPDSTNIIKQWDAGYALSQKDPNSRVLYTQQGMTLVDFKASSASSWLLGEILSNSNRTEKYNAKWVYDLDGSGKANDDDARQVMKWTRGWEYPIGASTGTIPRRAWPLGAIHRSTSAIVTPPGVPFWFERPGIDPTLKASYETWRNQVSISERPTIAIVGAQDGMIHAFDAGSFIHGDDPSSSDVEHRGYFTKTGGNRDYGDGSELWAWIPSIQLGNLKNNYLTSYYPETHPQAQVNGSIAFADIFAGTKWKSVAFFAHGTLHPYISASDITDTNNPKPLWDTDWTDMRFNGTFQSPAVAWYNSKSYGPNGKSWLAAISSGMSDVDDDVYLFMVDADDGSTLPFGKTQLNKFTGGSNNFSKAITTAKSLGVWGSPVAVDQDEDGFADRVYVADEYGRVWKYYTNGTNNNRCLIAYVGPDPIFVTPAFKVATDMGTGQKVVAFYFGTSDHPDTNDTVNAPYAFYAFVDKDQNLDCSEAELIYKFPLPPDEKVWADAFISGDEVYVGTSTGDKADICNEDPSNPGSIYSLSTDADSNGLPVQNHAAVSAEGNVVSGLMVYDEHLFINALGGKTKILGDEKWNNEIGGGAGAASYEDLYWKEY